MVDLLNSIIAVLGAYVAGVIAALTGIGGGVVMVPVFNIIVGLPFQLAVAMSLLAIVANATISSTRYIDAGLVDNRRAPLYSAGAVAGGFAGGRAALLVDEGVLAAAFSALVFYTSVRLVLQRRGGPGPSSVERRPSMIRGLTVGFVAGVLAGLLGVGGGIVMIPVMINLEGMEVKRVVATSSFVTAISASAALSTKLELLQEAWYAPLVALAAAAGSFTGSRLLLRIPRHTVALVLSAVLALVGVRMLLRSLGVGF